MSERRPDGHESWLEQAAAYSLGALDREHVAAFEEHLDGCETCRAELRWLRPAVEALPESVERLEPPPALRGRILGEARADAKAADAEERRQRHAEESRITFGGWLGRLGSGALGWKPLAGVAAAALVVVAIVGYEVGSDGGSDESDRGTPHLVTIPGKPVEGIEAKVVTDGRRGTVRLANVPQLPDGRVLEAWVMRNGAVEPVRDLFVPNDHGDAATTIPNIRGVDKVLVTREPKGGSRAPTSAPLAAIAIS